jgi:hypothetical protein
VCVTIVRVVRIYSPRLSRRFSEIDLLLKKMKVKKTAHTIAPKANLENNIDGLPDKCKDLRVIYSFYYHIISSNNQFCSLCDNRLG